jgi:hypothetical protein
MREAVLAHSQGDEHTLLRPVEGDGAPELGRHAPVHQLASEAFEHDEAPQVSPATPKVGHRSRAPASSFEDSI